MTNKTKIVICILIIAIVIVAIIGIAQYNKTIDNKANTSEDGINNIFDEYVNEEKENKNENEINNIDENNTTENAVTESNNSNIQNQNIQNNIIGKEEQESNEENVEVNDKQQAIELAKQEWGISVDSYDFQAELKEDKIYEVSVRNKTNRNVITIYTVNLKTGTVVE